MNTVFTRVGSFFLITLLLLCFPITALAKEQPNLITVGFPLIEGFSMKDPNGKYSGYTYDYLIQLSKYTGWDYNFVEGTPKELETMLEKGEIDLLGGVVKNEESSERFLFPSLNCGTNYASLCTSNYNSSYSKNDYQTFDGMDVAVTSNETVSINKLRQFCSANDIDINIIVYASQEAGISSMKAGVVDGVLLSDILDYSGLKVLAQLPSNPYYFAVSKFTPSLVQELDKAISTVDDVDPYFTSKLYSKHFPQNIHSFALTDEETKYVEQVSKKPIKVVSGANVVPVDYFSKGIYDGITADLLSKISAITEIPFEVIEAKNQEEAYKLLQDGEADLITNIYQDSYYKPMDNVAITSSYLSIPMIIVKNKNLKVEDIGLAKMGITKNRTLKEYLRGENVVYYDTALECIEAVTKGEVAYCYSNVYSAGYYQQFLGVNNIELLPLLDSNQMICFGMMKPIDVSLMTIMNKAITSIGDEERQQTVFSNINIQIPVTFQAFIRTNLISVILAISIISILFLLLIFYTVYKKHRIDENFFKRYSLLSDLIKETFFEYDYKTDQLTIPSSHAASLGIPAKIKNFNARLKNGTLDMFPKDVKDFFKVDLLPSIKNYSFEFPLKLSGEINWYRANVLVLWGAGNKPTNIVGKLANIDEERLEKERLLSMAQIDGLTGVYNKATMNSLIRKLFLQKDYCNNCAFLIVDIDDFKSINDTYGHQAGDEALKHIAQILKEPFSPSDIIGRIGGDEFAILMNNLHSVNLVEEKCKEILDAFKKPHHNGDVDITYSCSIGVSFYPEDGDSYDKIYQKSDAALYLAKRKGKNCFAYFSDIKESKKSVKC